jgi:hypothetical protein
MRNLKLASLAMLTILSACAKGTTDITPQYTSPIQYNSYSCSQIEAEMQSVSRHVSQVAGQVDKQHSDDQARMGVGLILFWPTLFFLDGDTPQAVEYARLQGEFNALEKAAIQKDCHITVERPKLPEKPKPAKEIPDYPSNKR